MKPEDVTKEMEVAFRQNVITTNRGSLIGLKAAIAAAINAMPQSAAQAQIDAAQEELRLCKQDAIKLQDECIALKAERDALRKAIKPFAEAIQGHYSNQPDHFPIRCGYLAVDIRFELTLGDFRRARAALAKEPT
jgi:septal ring factor EnvC (AmiA/AmiB activator)